MTDQSLYMIHFTMKFKEMHYMSLGVLLLILYSLIDHLSLFSNFLTQEYYNQYSVPIDISSWTIKECNVCYYAGYLFVNFNGILML